MIEKEYSDWVDDYFGRGFGLGGGRPATDDTIRPLGKPLE